MVSSDSSADSSSEQDGYGELLHSIFVDKKHQHLEDFGVMLYHTTRVFLHSDGLQGEHDPPGYAYIGDPSEEDLIHIGRLFSFWGLLAPEYMNRPKQNRMIWRLCQTTAKWYQFDEGSQPSDENLTIARGLDQIVDLLNNMDCPAMIGGGSESFLYELPNILETFRGMQHLENVLSGLRYQSDSIESGTEHENGASQM